MLKSNLLKLTIFVVFLIIPIVNGQEEQATLLTDDFIGQKVPAQVYFDKWLNEYVKWLILPDEAEEFENTGTIQAKMDLIELFWMKRDPIPETFYNEFKEEYYERLRYIYANFSYSDTPGILSHRGMIYSLLGEPDFKDENFTLDGGNFRRGDIFSHRAMLWVYSRQEGVTIPAYYQILFLKFGSNRWEIVADYWGMKSTHDSLLDSGFYGRQGYIPHRLESIMKEKREWYVKNTDTEELKKKLSSGGLMLLTNPNMSCSFSESEAEQPWGTVTCKIKYTDLIFKVENDLNIVTLEGEAVLKSKNISAPYKFPVTDVKLTDQELKSKFGTELELKTDIAKAPQDKGKSTLIIEIKDTKSGILYSSQIEIEKK